MSKAWNLAPTQWAQVLLGGVAVDTVAQGLPRLRAESWAAILLERTADSRTVLDLGSGRGQHSAVLALAGKETTLLDWSADNVKFSEDLYRSLNLAGRFLQADMLNRLPFDDNSFDTVFSCGVLEYFSDEEITAVIRESFRVAKKRVIMMVPNAWSLAYRLGKFYMEQRGTWQWGGERPFASLQSYFRSAGCNYPDEFSVATKTSLDFLTMPGGSAVKALLTDGLRLKDHPQPSWLRQGYLLVTIGEKP